LRVRRNGCLERPRQPFEEERPVDALFIIVVIALYAVTHWIVRALSRLGGVEWVPCTSWAGCSHWDCASTCSTPCSNRRNS